jgi:hypothetical protein
LSNFKAAAFRKNISTYVIYNLCFIILGLTIDKLPWAKYIFSFWIVPILAALTAKYLTENSVILVGVSAALYWLFLKGFSSTQAYR